MTTDKAALKRAYKEAKRAMGIYRISSSEMERVYIGCATDLAALINRHRFELKFGSHRNRELQKAWNSLGEAAFEFDVLDRLPHQESSAGDSAEELQLLLAMWRDKLESEGVALVML